MPYEDVSEFIELEMSNSQGKDLSAMDIVGIMSEFKVSFDMALNRLENLSIIDINQKLRLNSEKIEKSVDRQLRNVGKMQDRIAIRNSDDYADLGDLIGGFGASIYR